MSRPDFPPIQPDQLEALLDAQGTHFVFKHSPFCFISMHAFEHVQTFAARNADVPVSLIDVIEGRETSRAFAEAVDVRHASPQILLMSEGRVVWSASHGGVTAKAMEAALASLGATRPN